MRYCFDIDNTICFTRGSDYHNSVPRLDIIKKINQLYDGGHHIIFMTARGASSGIDWEDHTIAQLSGWNVRYHELICNKKPNADLFIDDKAVNIEDWNGSPGLKGIVCGAFDLMHPGYIRLFDFCKSHCAHLTVALHEDPAIERENKSHPVFTLAERKEILLSLRQVDNVVFYKNEKDLLALLGSGAYDVRFLGSDYRDNENRITGKDEMPIIYHDRVHDWSYSKVCSIVYENYKRRQEGLQF